jgi:hypothetical protein
MNQPGHSCGDRLRSSIVASLHATLGGFIQMALWKAKRGSGLMVSRPELVEENRPVPRLIRLGVGNVLGFYCVPLMPF